METRYLQDRFRVHKSETLADEVERVLSSISLSYTLSRSIYVPFVDVMVVNGSSCHSSGNTYLQPITTLIYEYPEGSVVGQFFPGESIPMCDLNNVEKGRCAGQLLYLNLPPRLTELIDSSLHLIRRQDL